MKEYLDEVGFGLTYDEKIGLDCLDELSSRKFYLLIFRRLRLNAGEQFIYFLLALFKGTCYTLTHFIVIQNQNKVNHNDPPKSLFNIIFYV